jgi:dsRNA-specific ribonuclease
MTDLKKLASVINYDFRDISFLRKALFTEQIFDENDGSNRKNYTNESLATLGDTILKFYLTEKLYHENHDKKSITIIKSLIENNTVLKFLSDELKVFEYAFNQKYTYKDAPEHEKLPHSNHDFYLEAVIAAVYLDRGMKYTKEWLNLYIYPQLIRISNTV